MTGWYKEWYEENEKELMSNFVDDNPDEWNEFLDMKRATLEQDDFDYWAILFCKEEMEQDFIEYCENAFDEECQVLQAEARMEGGN